MSCFDGLDEQLLEQKVGGWEDSVLTPQASIRAFIVGVDVDAERSPLLGLARHNFPSIASECSDEVEDCVEMAFEVAELMIKKLLPTQANLKWAHAARFILSCTASITHSAGTTASPRFCIRSCL